MDRALLRDLGGGPGRGARDLCAVCGFCDQAPETAEQAATWQARVGMIAGVQVALCEACAARAGALLAPTIPATTTQGLPKCACGAHELVALGAGLGCTACVRAAVDQVAAQP
jgi:hypothetical protein